MENHTNNKVMICEWKGKQGYKLGEDGFCCTFNKNKKSREKAYKIVTGKISS